MTTLDGDPVFGEAVTIHHVPHVTTQHAGASVGRTFQISGVLSAPDIPTLNAVEATLLSYADGLPHTLVDNRGRSWFNVIFGGVYVPSSQGPCPVASGGWCLPYRLVMSGLT